MLAFVLHRVLQGMLVMRGVAFIAFGLFHFAGDPVPLMLPLPQFIVPATVKSPEPLRVPELKLKVQLASTELAPFSVSVEESASVRAPVPPPSCNVAAAAVEFTVTV